MTDLTQPPPARYYTKKRFNRTIGWRTVPFTVARGLTAVHTRFPALRVLPLAGVARAIEVREWPNVVITRRVAGVRIRWHLWNPRDNISRALFYRGVYEPQSTALIARLVRPEWHSVDVGANTGYFSVLLSLLAPHGRVVAFEPSPTFRARAGSNVKRNGLNGPLRITLHALALGEEPGEVVLTQAGSTATLIGEADVSEAERRTAVRFPVRVDTLDHAIAEHRLPRLDFIKIDVDGYEAQVLRGAERTVREFRPHVLMEYVPAYGVPALEVVAAPLFAAGYLEVARAESNILFSPT